MIVGNRVVVTREAAPKYHGATGTLVRLPTQLTPQAKVRLDRPHLYGHGDGTGHAYFMWGELRLHDPIQDAPSTGSLSLDQLADLVRRADQLRAAQRAYLRDRSEANGQWVRRAAQRYDELRLGEFVEVG
ncbi:hypothetical protein IHN63_00055 [Deinococcus sp. 6YEL10]|uniref:hypothetical protein n=1 Tax=Deinococcus sp. 6YEL10 TaxID=2745870 RepID=UPI001E42D6FE|nr:hypothetical protein [Deinococcus sp. 6YEL10]MCD0159690.1 hypothetical protein [Deinococcus sp. 6YEL10]